jgi:6-phosphogluconolactonase
MACLASIALRAPLATKNTSGRGGKQVTRVVAPARRLAALRVPATRAKIVAAAGSADEFDLSAEDIDLEFVGGEFVVEAFDDADALATALCMEVVENAKACIEERGAFTFAVPGGSVAKSLSGLKDVKDVDWAKVHLFFVNERVPGSKCLDLAMDTWARDCGIPAQNVHAVKGDSPAKAAADYEDQMRQLDRNCLPLDEANGLPVFDLVLLGMGADGHVGSIYPDSDALNDESGAAVLPVEMPSKMSITMSLALINTADRVVVAASGAKKAETVRVALEEEESRLPGALCDAFSQIWFLDKEAASKLQAYEDMDEEDE